MKVADLKKLTVWMRSQRVHSFSVGGVSVTFHPLAFVEQASTTEIPGAEATEQPATQSATQEHYFDGMDIDTLLHSA
jgi:hypothetical protein